MEQDEEPPPTTCALLSRMANDVRDTAALGAARAAKVILDEERCGD
jgi:hypothetical protein